MEQILLRGAGVGAEMGPAEMTQARQLGPLIREAWCLRSRMNETIFAAVKTFAQVLDSADELGLEEQESLVEVLQHRVAERRRDGLLEAVKSARREFEGGGCRPATPKQIVKRIFA